MDNNTIGMFLTELHRHQTDGKLVFHAFKQDKASSFSADMSDDFFSWIEQHENDGYGIHVRQARMKNGSYSATKRDVCQITHLWIDIDKARDEINFVESGDDPIPDPTFVVDSGKGVHMYWRLTEPATDFRLFEVEEVNKKLASFFDGDPAPTHIASTLRLVGTLNHKYDPPRMCKILRHNEGAEVSLGYMAEWLKRNENPVEAFADRLLGNVRQPTDWQAVIDNLAVEGPANEFGGRNNCVTKLAGWWARQGIEPEMQIKTLVHHGCNLPMWEMHSIVNRMYQRELENA